MLHHETVEAGTLDLIQKLMLDEKLNEFHLVGGTALSLQLGHRKSVDVDLFNLSGFDSKVLSEYLVKQYQTGRCSAIKNGVFCQIEGVKVDLMSHQYPRIKPLELVEGIRIESLEDIGAMKLNAIVNAGNRLKDFVDMYFLLEVRPLAELTDAFEKKYSDVNKHMAHAALRYFEDIAPATITYMGTAVSMPKIRERMYQSVLQPSKRFDLTFVRESGADRGKDLLKEPSYSYGYGLSY